MLTRLEVSLLVLATQTIATELGGRFLADYLSGDKYFGTERPGQVSLERFKVGPSCAKPRQSLTELL